MYTSPRYKKVFAQTFRWRIPQWLALIALAVGLQTTAQAAKVLFVTTGAQRDTVKFINILKAQGHDLTVWNTQTSGNAMTAAAYAAEGYQLLIVDEVISSGAVGASFRNSPIPVINWEGYLYSGNRSAFNPDTGLSGGNYNTAAEAIAANSGAGADYGQLINETAINIVDPSNPLAAGLPAGTTNVFDPNVDTNGITDGGGTGVISFAGNRTFITSGVHVAATVPGFSGGMCVFGVDAGVLNADGTTNMAKWVHLPWNSTEQGRHIVEPSYFLFEAAIAWALDLPQPTKIHNLLPESSGFVSTNVTISFSVDKMTAGNSMVDQSGIHLMLNGTDVIGDAQITDGGSTWNVSYNNPLEANKNYTIVASATAQDGGFSARQSNIDTFDENNYSFEAEDWNFDGGQYFTNIVLCQTIGGGTPGCYYDRVGITNIDENEINGTLTIQVPTGTETYRYGSGVTREEFVDTYLSDDPLVRQKYITAGIPDYEVRNTANGERLNYTRPIPAGTYNVYARVSSANPMDIQMDEVDDGTSLSQTVTNNLGHFVRPAGTSGYELVPLTDAAGTTPLVVAFDGSPVTIRMTALSDGFIPNFYMFVPSTAAVNQPPAITGVSSPAGGDVLMEGSAVTVAATATDDVMVTNVQFNAIVNGNTNLIANVTTAPYTAQWAVPSLGALNYYTIEVIAQDGGGLSDKTNLTVKVVDPTLKVITTADGNGADSELREDSGGDTANGTGSSMNVRIIMTGTSTNRHETIGLRFDVGTNNLAAISSPSINMVSFRGLGSRHIHVYGVIDGTTGLDNDALTPGYTDNDWDETNCVFSTMPGLVWDADPRTQGLTNVVDLGVLDLTRNEGEIWSFTSPALTSFLHTNPDNVVTFVIEQDDDSSGQSRFATKEATALTSLTAPAGTANWYAPFLSFRYEVPTVKIMSATREGTQLTLSWAGGSGPYTIQKKTNITDAWADEMTGISGTSAMVTISGNSGFYRVVGQ